MPHSLVINFSPLSPISPQYLSGRHLHALFLTLVTSVDQKLGDYLHDSPTEKAFTLSPLQIHHKQRQTHLKTLQWAHHYSVQPGTKCWFRVSLLEDSLLEQLKPLWLNLNTEQLWHLGSADLKIMNLLGSPQVSQPWANACSYQQLYQQASESDHTLKFNFATPTAFRQGKYDNSLPSPESVFNSIRNRWNKYSGIEINELPLDFLFPSAFDIKTEMVTDSRSKFIGCVGKISYRLFGNLDPLQIKQINALADFALYCGVGRKTTMGMGMVRRERGKSRL